MSARFKDRVPDYTARIEKVLDRWLPPADKRPERLHSAMRYAVLGGGKRMRPLLIYATGETLGVPAERLDAPAAAVEIIHAYSLIHDDLPALDNDDLRRGKPTCHKKFGDAIAILAGDALLTLAFETVSTTPVPPSQCVAMVKEVASAAGTINGMVGGQVADLEAERQRIEPEMLEYIHRSKTAALIRASVTAGALCAGAGPDDVARLRRFGETIGWAFQVTDDILDVEESSAALGKTAGKDIAQQKATYPAIHGLQRSHEIANDLAAKAIAELAPYREGASRLREVAEYLVIRRT